VLPTQTGELDDANAETGAFITTAVVAEVVQLLAFVTVSVYVPCAAEVTLLILGACILEVNEFGPLQMYELIPEAELKVSVLPTQLGEFELGFGTGKAFITTAVVAVEVHPAELVMVSV
jgi:hypothetical protein